MAASGIRTEAHHSITEISQPALVVLFRTSAHFIRGLLTLISDRVPGGAMALQRHSVLWVYLILLRPDPPAVSFAESAAAGEGHCYESQSWGSWDLGFLTATPVTALGLGVL